MNANVTSFSDLQQYAQGSVVELPSFSEGQPFRAQLKRPSLLALVSSGEIPNSLLSTAGALFAGGVTTDALNDGKILPELLSVLDVICKSSLVAPTYQEIKEAGMSLTDEQMMFIFTYSQQGIKALENFHSESKGVESAIYLPSVSEETL